MQEFTDLLKQKALDVGFAFAGVTVAAEPSRLPILKKWLDDGFAGEMHYIESRLDAYAHPKHVLDGCRTLLMLGTQYDGGATDEATATIGKVARYARSTYDYHDVIHGRLKQLRQWTLERFPDAAVRGVVDTAPLLEREFAEAAGLGWVGKNTLLLNRERGSYFFLAALLTDLDLVSDKPLGQNHCGTCTACLTACPTDAFPQPYILDASKCISYLTIEHRGEVDATLREQYDGWLFGCDICQEVCPWNGLAARLGVSVDADFEPKLDSLDPVYVLGLSDEEFRSRFKKTPFWRTKRQGMIRNALILVAANRIEDAAEPLRALLSDADPDLRYGAAWAIAKIQPDGWQRTLEYALLSESEASVSASIRSLLEKSRE